MTINRQRKRAEKVRFAELKRRKHMSVILETKQLCKFYGTGENQVKAVNHPSSEIVSTFPYNTPDTNHCLISFNILRSDIQIGRASCRERV